MPITRKDDLAFCLYVMSGSTDIKALPIEKAAQFFKENIDPEDVYDLEQLKKLCTNYDIETIFGDDALIDWAEKNGYTKSHSED